MAFIDDRATASRLNSAVNDLRGRDTRSSSITDMGYLLIEVTGAQEDGQIRDFG